MTRRTLLWVVVALVVMVVELGATIGTVTGAPFAPVGGWGATRPVDELGFVAVVLGCGALSLLGRFPITAATLATASYMLFAVRDHELGMFLPPMIALVALAARPRHLVVAIVLALVSLAAGLGWVAHRAAPIADPGVALLAWVAFGAVLAAFFLVPVLVGEIIRARSALRDASSSAVAPMRTRQPDGGLVQGPYGGDW
ncbi:hypothetical protein [Brachybacterium sp. FME24]|uniref:hypothetical protein n=1 Tax=Brachybacterium sp. FME24 TaxID=2742605 RepID=UPI0018695FAB|nr:hypothetical protein [Brachybacterium sp. FME24]